MQSTIAMEKWCWIMQIRITPYPQRMRSFLIHCMTLTYLRYLMMGQFEFNSVSIGTITHCLLHPNAILTV